MDYRAAADAEKNFLTETYRLFHRFPEPSRHEFETHARIRRIALAAYLGLTDDLPAAPPYLRVLGMTAAGAELIRAASPSLPYVMRPADLKKLPADAQRIFELEARADDIYALCTAQRRPAGLDYTERLIRV